MKSIFNQRVLGISLVLASMLISATSFAALNAYLQLKGSGGRSYSCSADASGNFSFTNVEPGNYKLVWVLPGGSGEPSGACKIELSSFSWGTSNSGAISGESFQGKSTQVTRSNISNNRSAGSGDPGPADATGNKLSVKSSSNIQNNLSAGGSGGGSGKVSVSDFHFTCDASQVSKSGSELSCTVLDNIVVTGSTSPSGKVGSMTTTYDLKKGTK